MRDHRSLLAWQRAHAVVLGAMELSQRYWKPSAQPVFRQLQSASLSVQLNIAEGYARGARRQFRYHLRVAYGSAVETEELLHLCLELDLVPQERLEAVLGHCRESQALLMGLMKSEK